MRRCIACVHAAALVALAGAGARAQMPEGVVRDSAAATLSYADLDRFADAFARLPAVRDTAVFLDTAYLARGTAGLRVYAAMYDVDGAALRDAIRANPARYADVAARGAAGARAIEADVRSAFRRLRELYPEAIFPRVHYLVGPNRAGGALAREGLLIAVETHAPDDWPALVHLVAHELAHYQQAAWNVELYQREWSLLARAIKEGAADFVARVVSGDHTNAEAHAYGLEHEAELWRRFREEMADTALGDWFFARPADPALPRNLGYFVGYRIARARFLREPDARDAMRAVLRVQDYRAFLEQSGYHGTQSLLILVPQR